MTQPHHDDRFAAQLRGFGPIGIAVIVALFAINVIPPVGALLVLAWASRTNTPLSELGYVRPKNWILTVAGAVVFGVVFKLVMKAVVMPLIGAPPVNQPYHDLVGNTMALPGALYLMIAAGFGEEALFRGFLFQRLRRLLGTSAWTKPMIVLLTTVLFASAHLLTLGLPGAEQAVFTGLAFGTIFAATGSIWFVMIAHAAFDLAAIAIIYFDLEVAIAHRFFS